jgi:hypothetical protein
VARTNRISPSLPLSLPKTTFKAREENWCPYLKVHILRVYFLHYTIPLLATLGSFHTAKKILNKLAPLHHDLQLNILLLLVQYNSLLGRGRIPILLRLSVFSSTERSAIRMDKQTAGLIGASAGMCTHLRMHCFFYTDLSSHTKYSKTCLKTESQGSRTFFCKS